MLGLVLASDPATAGIVTAVIAALAAVAVAWIGNRRIGKPNGKGNLVEMAEKGIIQNERLASQHDQILGSLRLHDEKLSFVMELLLDHIATPAAHGGKDDRSDYGSYDPIPEHGRR